MILQSGFGNATTAIPTEFHHRSIRPPGAPLLAELQFISAAELGQEVKILLQDLSPRLLEVYSKPAKLELNVEADAAFEKLTAIFPEFKLEHLLPLIEIRDGEPYFDIDHAIDEVMDPLIDAIKPKLMDTVVLRANSEQEFSEIVRACVTQTSGTGVGVDISQNLLQNGVDIGGHGENNRKEMDTVPNSPAKLLALGLPWPLIKSFKYGSLNILNCLEVYTMLTPL